MIKLAIAASDPSLLPQADLLSQQLGVPVASLDSYEYSYLLVCTPEQLELRKNEPQAPNPIYIDFVEGAMGHRIKYGGGKGQLIAKAVGLNKMKNPSVLDVTAGLGRDAFVLANLGCCVLMLERSPIVAALLEDGLQRAREVEELARLDLKMKRVDALDYMQSLSEGSYPDVIYIDPMFPESKKTALVKKEMRFLRDVVGDDMDAVTLLETALMKAKRRVVVKRSQHAPAIDGAEPSLVFSGKSSRFDVYIRANPA